MLLLSCTAHTQFAYRMYSIDAMHACMHRNVHLFIWLCWVNSRKTASWRHLESIRFADLDLFTVTTAQRERENASISNPNGVEKWTKYWNLTSCQIRLIVWQNYGKLKRASDEEQPLSQCLCLWDGFLLLLLSWLTLMQGDCVVGVPSHSVYVHCRPLRRILIPYSVKCANLNSFVKCFFSRLFSFHRYCASQMFILCLNRTVIDFQKR